LGRSRTCCGTTASSRRRRSCGDEIARGKPDPEIYLLAARRLAVDPRDCVAIEDAPNGVQAAKHAGMRCIAVTNSVARERLEGADLIVTSLADDLSAVLS